MANEEHTGKVDPAVNLTLFVSTFEVNCPSCGQNTFRSVASTATLREGDILKISWSCTKCGAQFEFRSTGEFIIERVENGPTN